LIRILTILAALGLAGCATKPTPAPQVTVSGPMFSRSQLRCGDRPLPPASAVASSAKAASATAHHINDLGTWGQSCSNKLQSLGGQLEAAGLVAGQPAQGE